MRIVTDKKKEVASWASRRLGGKKFVEPYVAVGIESNEGLPRGAVVFNGYTGEHGDVEASIVGKGAFGKEICRYLFRYVFDELKVRRLTVRTRADNQKVIEIAIKFGWRVEGRQREAYPDGCDAILFGMLRHECNFL